MKILSAHDVGYIEMALRYWAQSDHHDKAPSELAIKQTVELADRICMADQLIIVDDVLEN